MKFIYKQLAIATTGAALFSTVIGANPAQAANLLFNGSFEQGTVGLPRTFSEMTGGAAAPGWWVWHNTPATTTTELLPSTLPNGGEKMMHVTTTGWNNGLLQVFGELGTGPETTLSSAWLYVLSGKVAIGTGNGGGTGHDKTISTTDQWVKIEAKNGGSPANEFIIYSASQGGAEFYVDMASVEPVPEPLTILGSATALGFGALLKREHSRKQNKSKQKG
ncbi:PEP-CTERM sorting domain-containing protein [Coleofasciculus sp.]|uniref:PEP-CTERM sorting domain-containing protein n=1 Tax=Coleofasciculus sp. TaxID=3100458 RepID=UPI003A14E95A